MRGVSRLASVGSPGSWSRSGGARTGWLALSRRRGARIVWGGISWAGVRHLSPSARMVRFAMTPASARPVPYLVMAALVAAIHVAPTHGADMDARNKSAHDGVVVDGEGYPQGYGMVS